MNLNTLFHLYGFFWQIHYRETKKVSEFIVCRKREKKHPECLVFYMFHPNRVSGNGGHASADHRVDGLENHEISHFDHKIHANKMVNINGAKS